MLFFKKRFALFYILLLWTQGLLWAATPPDKAQLDAFIQLTDVRSALPALTLFAEAEARNEIRPPLESLVKAFLQGAGKSLTEEEIQRYLDEAIEQRLLPAIKEELSWEKVEKVLQAAFSTLDAADIEAVSVFLRSPAGQAFQETSLNLLQDKQFIAAAINATPTQLEEIYKAKLSAEVFKELQQFKSSPAGQRIESKLERIMQYAERRAKEILNQFIMQEPMRLLTLGLGR